MKRWVCLAYGPDLTDDLPAATHLWLTSIPTGHEPAADPQIEVTAMVEFWPGLNPQGIGTRIEGWAE